MYSEKALKFEFTLPGGKDGEEKITLSNVRAMVRTDSSNAPSGLQAEIALYGLSQELLSILSSHGTTSILSSAEQYGIKIYAGDFVLFDGNALTAYANMNAMPDNALMIYAQAGLYMKGRTQKPATGNGDIKVEELLDSICKLSGYTLKPVQLDGITERNPYIVGDTMTQISAVCFAHALTWQVIGKEVIVWRNDGRVDDIVPLVSPENGLIGYPVYGDRGMTFQTQFSPLLSLGRVINLQTSLPHASGSYMLYGVSCFLSSWVENGPWHNICFAQRWIPDDDKNKSSRK